MHFNPEGSVWEEVPTPGEVVQISCGPADLLWGVLWEGQFLVREGITRDCPKGELVCTGIHLVHCNIIKCIGDCIYVKCI